MTTITNSVFTDKKAARRRTAILGTTLIVIFLLIALLVSLIPSSIGKLDLTSNKMYTLGDISRDIASSVSKDVTIYLISPEGSENETVKTVMQRYTRLNPKIKFDTLDPDKHENLISKYHSSMTEDNSALIVCGDNARYIPYSAFFSYSTENYKYCYQLYTFYAQYGYIDSNVTFADFMQYFAPTLTLYDGYEYELQLTTAIKAVSSDKAKKVYIPAGHGENGISQDLANRFGVNLFETKVFDMKTEAVPDDCSTVLLIPIKDLTEKEYTTLSSYLQNGGKVILMTSYSSNIKFENLLKLTEKFGLTTNFDGYLCEDDENYNSNNYQALILPDVSSPALADALEKHSASLMLGGATGIKATVTDKVTHTPLLTTSPTAYEKHITEDTKSLAFDETTDKRGSFYTAIKAESSDGGSLVWISSTALVYDDFDPHCSRGNKEAFIHILNELTGNVGALEIQSKNVPKNAVSVPASYIYTVLAIFALLAIASITFGIIRYRKRR